MTATQIAKLLASDGEAYDSFGISVAISESIAIVGAPYDDDNGSSAGSAYLFDVTTGAQIAKLLPSDGAAEDRFGISVAISGSTAIVGAFNDDGDYLDSGSAYLFDVATGTQIAKLLPSDGSYNDRFGVSVAISGSTVIVGAYGDTTRHGRGTGSAYLFDAATGTQLAKLLPSDSEAGDSFGGSVAISGSTAIVGASGDDDKGPGSGSAYLYDASWVAPPMFALEYSGDCPGLGTFKVIGATADGRVVVVSGFGDGPTTVPNTLPCAGALLNVGSPQLSTIIIVADFKGVAVLHTKLPAAACGQLRVQALDVATCKVSEVVRP